MSDIDIDNSSERPRSRARRLIHFFDPAREGFFGCVIRGLVLLIVGCACMVLAGGALFLRIEPGRHLVAYTLTDLGYYEKALDWASGLVADYPESDWEYYRLKAQNLRYLGRYEESLAVYEAATEVFPDNWWPFSHLCFYTALLGDPSTVMDACDTSVELVPKNLPSASGLAHDRRAIARALVGDREGAIEDFETSLDYWGNRHRGQDPWQRQARERWLEGLRNGEDPITEEDLQKELERY